MWPPPTSTSTTPAVAQLLGAPGQTLSSGLTALSVWLMTLIVLVCGVLASYMFVLCSGEPKETGGLAWNRVLCWVNSAVFTLFVVVYTIVIACFTS